MKYVITDKGEVQVGPDNSRHRDLAQMCKGKVVRAGHYRKNGFRIKVYGKSHEFDIKALDGVMNPVSNNNPRGMYKTVMGAAMALSLAAIPASAFAFELPGPVSVQTAYASGQGAVDFTKSAEVQGTFTISDDQYDAGEWITAGDVANGASGFGFYAKNGMLYVVASDGSFTRRIFSDFFAPGTTITVDAKYDATARRIDFKNKTWSKALNMPEYGYGVVMDGLPWASSVSADPLRVLLNPQNYGTTTLSVMSWSYR
ncbi:MAG: hypothetical protein KGI03_00830 [Patescibacteria group bacterium]|nr:hypothetical protein [Patescibacteria group bacterium]